MSRPGESTLRLLLQPVAHWLAGSAVTEICVNRPGEIWVEQRGMWATQSQSSTLSLWTASPLWPQQ